MTSTGCDSRIHMSRSFDSPWAPASKSLPDTITVISGKPSGSRSRQAFQEPKKLIPADSHQHNGFARGISGDINHVISAHSSGWGFVPVVGSVRSFQAAKAACGSK